MENYKMLENIKSVVDKVPVLKLDKNLINNSKLCIIDMNNGFAKAGALYSDRVEQKIPSIVELAKYYLQNGGRVLAYNDYHNEDAKEFNAYPKHCVKNTEESKLVDELEKLKKIGLEERRKNSTNGVFAYNPAQCNSGKDYVVVGCVTDICVYQFAVSLRTYLNENNFEGEVYVVKDLVDTFHIPDVHDAEFYNYMFIKSMIDNGVKVVSSVEYKND